MYMPHLGHAHAANSAQYGRRKTDRNPPPQRGLQLGVIWYRLVAGLERPRVRRRTTDRPPTTATAVAAVSSRQAVARRPVLQLRADVGAQRTP